MLEGLVLAALKTGRGSVSFSGGRDSSLVLAVATHVARREGLRDPVAVTMRHASAASDEREWQEVVIRHLGIRDWVIVDISEDMDVLGTDSARLLTDRGLLWPPNAYLHLPMVAAAPNGVMLTGAGGDEILGTRGDRLARLWAGRERPRARDALSVGLALAPHQVRARRAARSQVPSGPWIRPTAQVEIASHLASSDAAIRWRWDVAAVQFADSRSTRLGRHALATVGAWHGTPVESPLMDAQFVRAFAASVGPAGPVDRTTAMRTLAADLLPDSVLRRRTKAVFDVLIWGPRFRDFVDDVRPELPAEFAPLVDGEALQREWDADSPHFQTLSLLQCAWLARRTDTGGVTPG